MGRFICSWGNNIKMGLKEYWWKDADKYRGLLSIEASDVLL
jgi:hypothetical protein